MTRLHYAFVAPSCVLLLTCLVSASPADTGLKKDADEDGYVDLFANGDFSAWHIDGKDDEDRETQRALWSFEDGIVKCVGKRYGFIRYDEKLCDFSARLEFRLQPRGNSGVGIRALVYEGGSTRPSKSGYELQILDDAGKSPHRHSSMSLYRHVAPTKNAMLSAGHWNDLEITCRGPRIQVVLNGTTVQDLDQGDVPAIKDKPLCGHFLLQNHGSPVEFRNVRLKTFATE